MPYVLGIDIGATTIKGGLIAPGGKIVKSHVHDTESARGRKVVLDNILRCVENLWDPRVKAIGVGCPGPLDIEKGIVLKTPNIPLQGVHLRDIIKKRFKVPVLLENDATAYIYGEACFGSCRKKKNIVGLTIGTGMGGAIIIDGKIYRGRGNAGELGHMSISYKGIKGKHGHYGELEEYVSLRGVMRHARGLGVETPKDLSALAHKGNRKAIAVWKKEGYYLGVAVADLIYAFDPDVVVIGGNIANAWEFFAPEMKRTVKERVTVPPPPIVKRRLANRAGILGSGMLALEMITATKKQK
ncbi:MAG: ROK family protein [archaeon]